MKKFISNLHKKMLQIKSLPKNEQGFTLLEVVVVITIMGFLVSMTVPAIGHISKAQKVRATQQKLEEIKTSIIGNQDVFDDNGLPVVNGYVGDVGKLPKLYYSEIDENTGEWKWSYEDEDVVANQLRDEILKEKELKEKLKNKDKLKLELIKEDNNGKGQPRGLWMKEWGTKKDDIGKPSDWEEEDLKDVLEKVWYYASSDEKWKGPYISDPKAMYPDAAKNLDPKEDKELYEKRETKGKAIDAWGRSLYFFKEYELEGDESTATLLIVSQGPDEEITFPDLDDKNTYSKVSDEEANKDNIVVKITPNEWHEAYNKGKEKDTKEQLETIREALVGSLKSVDKSGQRIIGGYLGDMGQWPTLYELKEKIWIQSEDGQPAELWLTSPKEDMFDKENEKSKDHLKENNQNWELDENIKTEIDALDKQNEKLKSEWKRTWKGPYITAPWNDILLDSWEKKLKFEITKVPATGEGDESNEEQQRMVVRSAGIDGEFGTDDDLSITIDLDEWANQDVIIDNGKVTNITKNDAKKLKETKETLEEIRVALLGSKDARDASGRRIIGGYLSDVGKWPTIYGFSSKRNSDSKWFEGDGENSIEMGQPIGLWNRESTENSDGFAWKGPYLSNAENKPLIDAWGEFIRFRLTEDTMTVTSAGIDGKFFEEGDTSDDDIKVVIKKSDWMAEKVTIKGIIYNNGEPTITIHSSDNGGTSTNGDSNKNVDLELYSRPDNSSDSGNVNVPNVKIKSTPIKRKVIRDDGTEDLETIGHDNTISGAGKATFTLTAENVVLGKRKLRLTGGGLNEEVELFIGEGGTVSPSSDKLNFTIK